ncbi:MAG: NTP transferase domain-containing protein [Gammaproteobacteria bacterium]|nr:NTP transferase domain-containing protein [Gammaproteobacteria bacterium]
MAEPAPPLLGLVLAGGRSERLGTDKAAVVFGGLPMLARTVALLGTLLPDVRVAIRPDQAGDALRRGFRLVIDGADGSGPAAGILAAHAAEPHAAWLVMACDLPGVGEADLARLVAARDPARDATAFRSPRDDRPEPLCAIYEPATLARFQRQVAGGGNTSPRGWLEAGRPVLLQAPAVDQLDSINTREDLRRLAPSAVNHPAR